MNNLFNLADGEGFNKVFFNTYGSWISWEKPRNCRYVYMFLIGGGGGGGGSFWGIANTAPGGGGGGSSAICTGLFPAALLPNTLLYKLVREGLVEL